MQMTKLAYIIIVFTVVAMAYKRGSLEPELGLQALYFGHPSPFMDLGKKLLGHPLLPFWRPQRDHKRLDLRVMHHG